jgi:hypothetical protein
MAAYEPLPQAGPSSQRTSARTAKSSRRTRGSTGPAVMLGGGAGALGSATGADVNGRAGTQVSRSTIVRLIPLGNLSRSNHGTENKGGVIALRLGSRAEDPSSLRNPFVFMSPSPASCCVY